MPDVFTKSKRSQVMARIRSTGNKDTEVVLARRLTRQWWYDKQPSWLGCR